MTWIGIERVTWAERALWLALVAVSVAPIALQPGPEEVARRYVEALNRGDVEAALDLTTSDLVIRPPLGGYYYRAAAARNVLEWRATLNERWRILESAYDAESRTVRLRFELANDAWRLVGPPPVLEAVLAMRGSRVLSEVIQQGSDDRLWEALAPFLAWARAERPRALHRVWRAEGPLPSRAHARLLLELLRTWRSEGGTVAGTPRPSQP